MRIDLNDDSYLEVKYDPSGKAAIIFRIKKDSKSTIVLTAKLDSAQIDDLVAQLVMLKSKVK